VWQHAQCDIKEHNKLFITLWVLIYQMCRIRNDHNGSRLFWTCKFWYNSSISPDFYEVSISIIWTQSAFWRQKNSFAFQYSCLIILPPQCLMYIQRNLNNLFCIIKIKMSCCVCMCVCVRMHTHTQKHKSIKYLYTHTSYFDHLKQITLQVTLRKVT
jgi:hypothetical protein